MRALDYNKLGPDGVPLVPEHIQGALKRYYEDGIPGGDFLHAVLCNNLAGAFRQADSKNLTRLRYIVQWVYWVLPASAWGNSEAVEAWMALGGMRGYERIHTEPQVDRDKGVSS